MSAQYAQLVEKINRIVRDRGDVELMVLLDRIADQDTETEQAAALGAVVKILNQGKKTAGQGSGAGSSPAPLPASQAAPAPLNTTAPQGDAFQGNPESNGSDEQDT